MTTLEDLYYGNISPHERYTKRGSRADQLVKLICKNEESLTAGLTEQQKETFEKFKDCQSERHRCPNADSPAYGKERYHHDRIHAVHAQNTQAWDRLCNDDQ